MTQSQDFDTLMAEIAELQDNKTNFDVYIHKLDPRNEIDFYDSIIKYYEFEFYAYAKLKSQTASATLTHMIWRVVSTIKAA